MLKTAVILAGGKGLRLMPYTTDIPKTMVSVLNKPLLHWILDWLEENGIKKVIIGVDYKKEVIMDYLKNNYSNGLEIVFNDHHGAKGTGDAFRMAIENQNVNDEEFIAMNGDELTDLSIKNFHTFHKQHGPIVSLVACPLRSPYGVIDMDHEFTVKAFKEKPLIDSHFVNAGIYIFNQEIRKYLPQQGNIEQTSFVKLAELGKLKAYKYYGFWRTIDTSKDLQDVEEKCKSILVPGE